MNQNPFSKQPTPMMEDLEAVTCTCGNSAFAKYYKLFKWSPLKSGLPQSKYFDDPIYVCSDCNAIFEPDSVKKEEE